MDRWTAVIWCNLLGLINVSVELEVIEENPNVTNWDISKINFNILDAMDKPAKNDSEIFDSSGNNLSLGSHSESRKFDSPPTPYAFDNNSCKSDISNDSTLTHVAQNPCGGYVDNFVISSYNRESTVP